MDRVFAIAASIAIVTNAISIVLIAIVTTAIHTNNALYWPLSVFVQLSLDIL